MKTPLHCFLTAALLIVASQPANPAACGPVYGADGIALDKNGDVWIAHYEDVRLGKLTPSSGRFEEYLPTTVANPTVLKRDTRDDKDGFSYKFDFGFYGLGMDDSHDAVWSLAFNSDKLTRFSRNDRLFTDVQLPGRSLGRFVLPVDAQGNVWTLAGPCCGQEGELQLVKINPQLEQQMFALQVRKAKVPSLTVGRDGTVWVSLIANDDTLPSLYAFRNGQFEAVPLPLEMTTFITRLHVDAQGDLWVATGDDIWRLHDNAFKRHPLPTPGAHPSMLASDTRGNLWFTEWHGNKIGRIDREGGIREYPIPPEEESPLTLAVAADGKVWFSVLFNYDLFRLDPDSGQIQSFPLPVPSNWSKNAAEGLSACVLKPKDALSLMAAKTPPQPVAAANQVLRHPLNYPDDAGAKAFEQNCHTACHSWYRVDRAGQRRTDWRPTVERMIEFNKAPISNEQRELIVDYLNRRYTLAKP